MNQEFDIRNNYTASNIRGKDISDRIKYDGSKKQQFRFETIKLHRKGKILKVYDLFNRKETAFEYAGNDWESVYRFMRK